MSPLTLLLKDCIDKPENDGRLKHYTPSILYISLKLIPTRISSGGKLVGIVHTEENMKLQNAFTYIFPICRKVVVGVFHM